jgi:glutathione S-transferase
MLTIYGTPRSRAAIVLWLMREIGMPYRHVDSPVGGPKAPEHLEVNPAGTMPVIKDDDFVLTESMAIMFYLVKKYGGDLGPQDLQEDAEMLRWTLWSVTGIDRNVVAIINNSGVDEDHPLNEAGFKEACDAIVKPLQSFDRELGSREYLVGDRLTVADINVAFPLSFLLLLNFDFSAFPNVERFMHSITGRTSFVSALAPVEEHTIGAVHG